MLSLVAVADTLIVVAAFLLVPHDLVAAVRDSIIVEAVLPQDTNLEGADKTLIDGVPILMATHNLLGVIDTT